MKKSGRERLVILCTVLVCIIVLVFSLFSKSASNNSISPPLINVLTDSISRIISACPSEIGTVIIINSTDTVKVNDKGVYSMMNVFKVHRTLALCNDFNNKGISLDILAEINRNRLDSKTWSSMMKDYSELVISLIVRDLLCCTTAQNGSNTSNLMFKDVVNVAQTDGFITALIPRSSLQTVYTEGEMSTDHGRAYFDYTSPLGAAMLMNCLFIESVASGERQSFIKSTLKECVIGTDRAVAPLLDKERVSIAHKADSGHVNGNGILTAHNDIAYICSPNNVCYTLVIFAKDFKGNESQASQYVTHIPKVIYFLLI